MSLSIIYFIVALVLSYITGILFLKVVNKYKLKQPIYEDAPERHQQKSGTPTLGAVVFLIPYLLFAIYFAFTSNYNFVIKTLMIIVPLGFSLVGIFDDLGKIRHNQNNLGLSPKMKLLLQFIVSIIAVVLLAFINDFNTEIDFIFFTVDFSYFYYIILILMFVGFSNASNLTDGLDGLLSSVTIVMFSTLTLIGFLKFDFVDQYLIVLIAALLGFLIFFNRYPAKMFMGDTGSLTLGAVFVMFIVLFKIEFVGALLAFIYLIEVFSVIIQTTYFKYTKKKYGEGKRVFKMAPLHHHYEQKGMSEVKVVIFFTLLQLLVSIIVIGILVIYSTSVVV